MNLHSSNNENRPYKIYGKSKAIRVKILSIVLIGGSQGTTPKGATVRFQRSVYDKSNGGTTVLDNKIATMEFVYKPNLRMDDQSRVENPLGFQVTSYRVDNDYGSTPPAEVPVQAAPAVQPAADAGVDPDDATATDPQQTALPSQAAAGYAPGAPANETIQRSALPPAPIPVDGAHIAPQPAGTPVPLTSHAAPAAHPVPQSAASGGRR